MYVHCAILQWPNNSPTRLKKAKQSNMKLLVSPGQTMIVTGTPLPLVCTRDLSPWLCQKRWLEAWHQHMLSSLICLGACLFSGEYTLGNFHGMVKDWKNIH
jgi:hypothetical protein